MGVQRAKIHTIDFKNNSFLGDKTKNKKEGNKKKKDFICYSKQSIYICPR